MKWLNPSLRPTPLLPPEERPAVVIEAPRRPRFRKLAVLYSLFSWLVVGLGAKLAALAVRLSAWLLRLFGIYPDPEAATAAAARRTRRMLEQLGFLAVKVGQLLSLRSDLFSPQLCAELSDLQYRSVGFPAEIAVETVERELGASVGTLFAEFERLPFAAASIAQVHRARLNDGRAVVVKVMRPDAPAIFAQDLALLRWLVRLLKLVPGFAAFRFHEFLWEVEQIAREEVDYRFELANLDRFKRSVRKHRVYVPAAVAALSTGRVLVMEAIEGVLMSDFIAERGRDPQRVEAWQRDNGVEPAKAGRALFLSFLRQVFEDNLFHGDLHPGNVVLLRDSRIALIDLGTLGTAEAEMVRRYSLTLDAIARRSFQKAADLTLSFSPKLPLIDVVEVREEMVRTLRLWEMRTHVQSLPYHDRSLSTLFIELTRIMAARGIATSWGLLRIDRGLTTMDASLNALIPQANYPRLFRRYFREREERLIRQTLRPETLRHLVIGLQDTIGEYKLFIEPLVRGLGRFFDGSLFSSLRVFALKIGAAGFALLDLFLLACYAHQRFGLFHSAHRLELSAQGRPATLSVTAAIDTVPAASNEVWIATLVIVLLFAIGLWRLGSKEKVRDTLDSQHGSGGG